MQVVSPLGSSINAVIEQKERATEGGGQLVQPSNMKIKRILERKNKNIARCLQHTIYKWK